MAKDSDVTGLADLNGKKIAVQEGTTGDLLCTPGEDNDVITDENTEVKRFKKGTDAIVSLNNGGVDAVVIDKNPAENFVASNSGKLKLIEDDTSTEEYAIAVKKGDTELLEKINSGLAKIKEDGTFDELVAQYIEDNTGAEKEASDNIVQEFLNNLKYVFVDTNGYQLMAWVSRLVFRFAQVSWALCSALSSR